VGHHINNGIFLLLGSNQDNPIQKLSQARTKLEQEVGKIIIQSAVYKTAAWGKTDQPDFFNQVIRLSSTLDPYPLLEKILGIEKELGRVRHEKWGSRSIDIDILFIGDQLIDIPDLKVPHPGIPSRKFTLVPLAEIAPDFLHPLLNKKISTLLAECTDPLTVEAILL
jgi:2-amino-4-hydroxy-6-hydroxymethyldihydropteridine diphosphokinase